MKVSTDLRNKLYRYLENNQTISAFGINVPFNRKLRKLILKPHQSLKDSKYSKRLYKKVEKSILNDNNSLLCTYTKSNDFLTILTAFDAAKSNLIAFNINDWKQQAIADFFPEFNVFFTTKKKFDYLTTEDIPKFQAILVWGSQKPINTSKLGKLPTYKIEDGFIRSIGLGKDKTRACSIVVDTSSLYYRTYETNDLELLYRNTYLSIKERDYYEGMIGFVKLFKVDKYNIRREPIQINNYDYSQDVLIIGQNNADDSIKFSSKNIKTNEELVSYVVEKNKYKNIWYKPHPDNDESYIDNFSSVKILEIDPIDNDSKFSKVYTICSLLGFELAIRGNKVHCVGKSFYANKGLTIDDYKNIEEGSISEKAGNQLTIDETSLVNMFHAAYVQYSKYCCPVTQTLANIEHILLLVALSKAEDKVARLLVSNVYNLDISKGHLISTDDLIAYVNYTKDSLIAHPYGYLIYSLLTSKELDVSVNKFLMSSVDIEKSIEVLNIAATFLIDSVKYDDLKILFETSIKWFNDCDLYLNIKQATLFQNSIFMFQRYLVGRKSEVNPKFDKYVLLFTSSNNEMILVNAFKILFNNCAYDEVARLLSTLVVECKITNGYSFWARLIAICYANPHCSETDFLRRKEFQSYFIKNLHQALAESKISRLKKRLVLNIAIYNVKEIYNILEVVKTSSEEHIKRCKIAPELKQLFAIFIGVSDFDNANYIIELLSLYYSQDKLIANKLKLYTHADGKYYKELTAQLKEIFYTNPNLQYQIAEAYRLQGDFQESKYLLESIVNDQNNSSPLRSKSLQLGLERINFLIETSEIINSVEQPKQPKGIIVLSSLNCPTSLALETTISVRAKQMGWGVFHLTKGMMINQLILNEDMHDINKYMGILNPQNTDGKILLDWHIDWDNQILECQGVNFYQGMYEFLSTKFRRYTVDIDLPFVNRVFKLKLESCDYILRNLVSLSDLLSDKNIPAVFITSNTHAAPYSIFRDYIIKHEDANLRFVNINVGYENYYSNLSGKYSTSTAIIDMKLYQQTRAPFLAVPSMFEEWYKEHKTDVEIKKKVDELLSMNRSKVMDSTLLLDKIKQFKAEGKKVVVCFGKILCDMAVPYDGGAAHINLVDWLNNTIEIVKGRDDIVLLIKPHPHELRKEIAMDLIDYLRDYLPKELPDNVIFLPHDGVNVNDLSDYIDLAVLWAGTSALELLVKQVPVLMASYFGSYDYPVDFMTPKSQHDYKQLILKKRHDKPSKDLAHRAAAILYYMGTTEVSIPNKYSIRNVTNDRVPVPKWNHEEVQDFLKYGDVYVDKAFNRCVEYFN